MGSFSSDPSANTAVATLNSLTGHSGQLLGWKWLPVWSGISLWIWISRERSRRRSQNAKGTKETQSTAERHSTDSEKVFIFSHCAVQFFLFHCTVKLTMRKKAHDDGKWHRDKRKTVCDLDRLWLCRCARVSVHALMREITKHNSGDLFVSARGRRCSCCQFNVADMEGWEQIY